MKLVVPNVEEFYGAVTKRLPQASANRWREAARKLSGSAYFWCGRGVTLLMPGPLEAGLTAELSQRSGLGPDRLFWPEAPSPELSLWAAEKLTSLAGCGPDGRLTGISEIVAWGQTGQLHELAETSANWGGLAIRGVGQREVLWIVDLLGSKCGLRHLLAAPLARGEVLMPEGVFASNLAEAAGVTDEFLSRGKIAVVKADRGVGGSASAVFDSARPPRTGIGRHLAIAARSFPLLRRGPMVVEELVLIGPRTTRSASVQCFSDGQGEAKLLFMAEHMKKASCAFNPLESIGARLGAGALKDKTRRALKESAGVVGRKISSLGFYGVMGIDYALDGEGRPHLLEVNPRRTTLSGAAGAARSLGGESWEERLSVIYLDQDAVSGRWSELPDNLRRRLYPDGVDGRAVGGWLPIPVPTGKSGDVDWAGAVVLSAIPETSELIARELLSYAGNGRNLDGNPGRNG